jgi:hypothetical protein
MIPSLTHWLPHLAGVQAIQYTQRTKNYLAVSISIVAYLLAFPLMTAPSTILNIAMEEVYRPTIIGIMK